MNPRLLAPFRRTALAAAISSLYLSPALSVQAAEPGPIGGEFRVNTVTTAVQLSPAIAVDADGDFVVTWASNATGSYEIRAQRYNAAGQAQGAEFQVNTVTTGSQNQPVVGIDADGDFVVAWTGYGSGNADIRAQRYNAAGVAQGGEFQVNTLATLNQREPAIALDADGDFVVAWTGYGSGNADIRAQRYNAAGVAQGGEFLVNTTTAGSPYAPRIALDADGDFVVVWQSYTGSSYEIRAQRYNAAGLAQSGEIQVNTLTTNVQRRPAVAMDADGDFVVAWIRFASGNADVRAQRYSAAGLPQGGEFQVNTTITNRQGIPRVASDADGDFVIAWNIDVTLDIETSDLEVRAQRYNASGAPQGEEIAVNTVVAGSQSNASVGMDADGDFVVAWASATAGDFDIRAQRYQSSYPIDLDLFQVDSADPAPVGSALTYTLSVGNLETPVAPIGIPVIDSAIGASAIRIVDTLPAGSTAVSATGTGWSCTFPTGRVSCNYNLPLPAGEQASLLAVTLTPPSTPGVQISNVARVSASQFDDNTANNRFVERTQLACAASVIELSASSYSVNENTSNATITVTRSGGACGAAAVQFDTAGSSAIPGLDFTDVTGTLSWADGELGDKTFSIPITNDALDEIDERLQISLSSTQGASLGARNTARLSIADNDASPRINFTSLGQTVPEAPSLITVTVQLSSVSGRDVSAAINRSGSATINSDYFQAETSFTIPAGSISTTLSIEIAGDVIDEPDETAVLSLSAPVGATLGTINPHTITIVDDDVTTAPTVSFDLAAASADEATASTVRVLLSAPSTETVTAPYTLSGTAKLSTDYSLSLPSPIVFEPGQVEKVITLAPLDDSRDETDERAVLTLVTPTNATLGTTIVHTRTIIDNDP